MLAASLTDWLQAGAAVLSMVATIGLLVFAAVQIRHIRDQAAATSDQAGAARDQVELMRADAKDEASRRAEQGRALDSQIAAVAGIATATRDAARAQVQPVVFAHARGAVVQGPNDELDLDDQLAAVPYYLANEGTGLALDVEHGIGIAGEEFAFGSGMRFRAMRPGEVLPPIPERSADPVPPTALHVYLAKGTLAESRRGGNEVVYWARFDNVFGERFETKNFADSRTPATLRRINGSEGTA